MTSHTYGWLCLISFFPSQSFVQKLITTYLHMYNHKTIQYFPIPLFCVVNLWTNLKNIHKSYEIFYNLIFFILLKIFDERTFLLFQDQLKNSPELWPLRCVLLWRPGEVRCSPSSRRPSSRRHSTRGCYTRRTGCSPPPSVTKFVRKSSSR